MKDNANWIGVGMKRKKKYRQIYVAVVIQIFTMNYWNLTRFQKLFQFCLIRCNSMDVCEITNSLHRERCLSTLHTTLDRVYFYFYIGDDKINSWMELDESMECGIIILDHEMRNSLRWWVLKFKMWTNKNHWLNGNCHLFWALRL